MVEVNAHLNLNLFKELNKVVVAVRRVVVTHKLWTARRVWLLVSRLNAHSLTFYVGKQT
jgi:hypothetical protein